MNFSTESAQLSFQVVRKHLFLNKLYYLYAFSNALVLSGKTIINNPKYLLLFNLESQIVWKVENF